MRLLVGYREAKEAARYTETPPFRETLTVVGIFRLNTDGVLLRGVGLCGRRYSRCTHCHEPHGGTVSNQTISRSRK